MCNFASRIRTKHIVCYPEVTVFRAFMKTLRAFLLTVVCAACGVLTAWSQKAGGQHVGAGRTTVSFQWCAGSEISAQQVEALGLDSCFTAQPIPDEVWARMQGRTYRDNPHIGRSDLCYLRLLHWDMQHHIRQGEMVCNRIIASRLVTIFRQLYEARYPIGQMVLPDVYDADDERQMQANNTSCFCYRNVPNTRSLSNHALGLAVDLNPRYNPYITYRKNGKMNVQPANGTPYCDRKADFRYKITTSDLAYRLFKKHGFRWGGSWVRSKDYQHFDKR